MRGHRPALVALALAGAAQGAAAGSPEALYVARLESAAILYDLNGRLLAGPSATRTLEAWCRDHRLADPAKIVANRVSGSDKPITAEQRSRLKIGADEPVRYRHVRLRCGNSILSEADNWYVPSRLTAAMNAQLDDSDTPFGIVVAPLGISRRTIEARLLWRPLDVGWDMQGAIGRRSYRTRANVPYHIIEHRALVLDAAATPIAEVTETYTAANLAFLAARTTKP
jgi:chorismate-pyruvate lyase